MKLCLLLYSTLIRVLRQVEGVHVHITIKVLADAVDKHFYCSLKCFLMCMQHEHTHQVEANRREHQGKATIDEKASPVGFGGHRMMPLFRYRWIHGAIHCFGMTKRFSMHLGALGVSISERAACEAQSLIDDH